MTNLAVFNFESHEVRFIEGKPVANDVAAVLGYADPQAVISKKISPKNKGVAKMETPGGIQSIAVLEEAGVYQLIFSSKLPSAEKFQDWVFSEVLPAIRKTGTYSLQPQRLPQEQIALNNIKTEIAATTKERGDIEQQIKEHEEAIKKLKDTYRKLDTRLLELADQFTTQYSDIIETYRLCEKEVGQMTPNPYDARYTNILKGS